MKLMIGLTAALALTAGAAAAQGTFSKPPKSTFGTFAPAAKAPAAPSLAEAYRPKPMTPPAAKPKSAMAPEPTSPPAFKPYEPWKPTPPRSQFGPDGRRKP
ncbi:MAG: hypothetical protein ABW360_17425 [Phenylobacterium sp.]